MKLSTEIIKWEDSNYEKVQELYQTFCIIKEIEMGEYYFEYVELLYHKCKGKRISPQKFKLLKVA